jgi:hypothetical protein
MKFVYNYAAVKKFSWKVITRKHNSTTPPEDGTGVLKHVGVAIL